MEGLGGFGTNAAGEPNTGLVGPMITFMLPLLIANQGGRMVYGVRGGVVAVVATMGVIVGTDIPMFLGAMIMGPFAAWCMKHVDKLWEGKIKPGFEMLVNNFSAGILAAALAVVGYFICSGRRSRRSPRRPGTGSTGWSTIACCRWPA